MGISLGLQPIELVVILVRSGAFVSALVADTPWLAGTAITLELYGGKAPDGSLSSPVVWPATVAGTGAAWDVTPTGVASVLDAGHHYARLHYTAAGGDSLVWGRGRISAS